jgi:hypothetical protein
MTAAAALLSIRRLAWALLRRPQTCFTPDGLGFLHEVIRLCNEALGDGGVKP